jgi:hypothetical protein
MKKLLGIILLLAGLMGCAGLSSIKGSVSQFDQGVNAVSANEMVFLKNVQSVDCITAFYIRSSDWARGATDNFDITGSCNPTLLTDDQVRLRQAMMDALTLYADSLQALASGSDYAPINSGAKTLSTDITKLSTQLGLPTSYPIGVGVQTAINALAGMLLDQKRFTDIRKAVTAASPYIEAIVGELKAENTLFAMSVKSKIEQVHLTMRTTVARERSRSMFDLITVRSILQESNAFGTAPIAGTVGQNAYTDPALIASGLNRSLDAVLAANKSILTDDPLTIRSAVNNLTALVKLATAK